ncbi:MAG: hypothetical protein CBB71_18985 [Rhodopirellula sp. TMED11]|nr:MAG: hypothetical protein CBB71_18985 [Rhodopirellula sp. TMED11]
MCNETLDLGLTHIALHVSDVEASVKFYQEYAGLHDIHSRGDGQSSVGWISDLKRPFGLVLLKRRGGPVRRWITRQIGLYRPALAHVGIALSSREQVDTLCERAREQGILRKPPRDAGHPVNYYGMIADPDGNNLELSFGQVMSVAFAEAMVSKEGHSR